MTTFEYKKMMIPTADLNGESSLPPIAGMVNVQYKTQTELDEDDELFIGYGFIHSSFPYRLQDMYDRELKDTEINTVVLENEYLKATFLPEYGGRLWSLYDKINEKELTFSNPVIRPCNLAIRNAWLSGGVEWNCGMVGHHPFTCSTLFTAKLKLADGTPVLRMYEFERIRRAVYQMDFFLPDGSKVLFARMRIVNPNSEVVPMYWWSNIAIPEIKKGRVIASVNDTYSSRRGVIKVPVPICEGVDITYPVNNPSAIDFFWKIPPEKRKYICQLDENGYGLFQTSTKRLKGRKLFVWGQGPGGDRWQEFLTKDDSGGRYAEIQAGLAHTQYECLPMPPKTAWEWLEAYGALQTDGSKIHGDWEVAKAETETRIDNIITDEKLAEILKETHEMAITPADEMIMCGSGWGALEIYRRNKQKDLPMCPHLDFGKVQEQQIQWKALLDNGYFSDTEPDSWILQTEWTAMIEAACNGADEYNWYAWLQLGMTYIALNRIKDAKNALERSMNLKQSCWSLYGLAHIARMEGNGKKAALTALKAALMKIDDISLVKEAVRMLNDAGLYNSVIDFVGTLPENVKKVGRIKLGLAFAYARTENIADAEKLIYDGGVIVIPDIREGEISVTELWYIIEELKAKRDGREFSRETAKPPASLDFRMGAVK
ncbi:MAG: DUF5107 domain-containing protein [Oscillospiraceae bacterium]|nr:DUF5107 domain-containing protein [Oscillospiraceae bacterium]